jgi:2,5-diamino-6-(ribosylamino)-4(3H)-pyrimidinone 5'-phosphate reductase
MKPRVILHCSVSVDGSVTGFGVDMGVHYHVASTFKAQAHLVGSRTALIGIQTFSKKIPPEKPQDFVPPRVRKGARRPYFVIPDTRAKLKGKLHALRGSGFCRDVIVLVSSKTPKAYLAYLKERRYPHHRVGTDRIDLNRALQLLAKRYGCKTVLTDSGGILNSFLLSRGLVDEISLLVHPRLTGRTGLKLFAKLPSAVRLQPLRNRKAGTNLIHLVYRVTGRRK